MANILGAFGSVVEDQIGLDHVLRPGLAAGIGYYAAPQLAKMVQAPGATAPYLPVQIPFVSGPVTTLSAATGGALVAGLTAYLVDTVQRAAIGPGKVGRLSHFPSLAMHVVAGGLLGRALPMAIAQKAYFPPRLVERDESKMIWGTTVLISELGSQFLYEVFTDSQQGSFVN